MPTLPLIDDPMLMCEYQARLQLNLTDDWMLVGFEPIGPHGQSGGWTDIDHWKERAQRSPGQTPAPTDLVIVTMATRAGRKRRTRAGRITLPASGPGQPDPAR